MADPDLEAESRSLPAVGTGRDPQSGRFAAGNQISRGNSIAMRTREMRRAIFSAVEAADVEAVIRQLMGQAKTGDIPAAKLFLEFTCGRPSQSLEITGKDGEPLGAPDLSIVIASVMTALAPFPEARFAVAASLRQTRSHDHDGPDGGLREGA